MALLHQAELRPSKLELLTPWLAAQEWAYPADGEWERVATYRFDDPAGEVGVETFILKSGNGPELHVPVTYRGAPLDAGDAHLIGTMDHSVLGKRWMYDGAGDPVYAQTLASTILSGGTEVEQYVEKDGQRKIIPGTAHVSGSGNTADSQPLPHSLSTTTTGSTTTIKSDTHTLVVLRRIGDATPNRLEHTLHGTWAAHDTPTLLAGVSAD